MPRTAEILTKLTLARKLPQPVNATTRSRQQLGSYYNAAGEEITQAAYYALCAAKLRLTIGRDAAMRFAINNGSTAELFRIACQLQAAASAQLPQVRNCI